MPPADRAVGTEREDVAGEHVHPVEAVYPHRPLGVVRKTAVICSALPVIAGSVTTHRSQGGDLREAGHRGVAGVGGDEGAVCPAQADRLLGSLPGQEAIEEAGGEAVAAADAVDHVERDLGGADDRAVDVAIALQSWRLAEWTSRIVVAMTLSFGYCAWTFSIMPVKADGSSAEVARDLGPGDAEGQLHVLLVAHEDVDLLDEAAGDGWAFSTPPGASRAWPGS